MDTISCSSAATVPKLYHRYGASSGKFSRFLLSSSSAFSRVAGLLSWCTYCSMSLLAAMLAAIASG